MLPDLIFSEGLRESRRLSELIGRRTTTPNVDVYAAYLNWRLPIDCHATVHEGFNVRLADVSGADAVSDNEPTRALRAALEQAVARSMEGADRVAVMTGGGVDSGILLALAVHVGRRLKKDVFAVALDYAAKGDDRPYLAELERHLRCEVVRLAPEEGADHVEILDGLDASPSFVPTATIEAAVFDRAKRAGAARILSGGGGDQLFDGKPTSLANIARRGAPFEALRRARRLRGFGKPRPLEWAIRPVLTEHAPARMRARRWAERGLAPPPWTGPAFRDFDERRKQHYRSRLAATLPDAEPFERYILEAQQMQVAEFSHQLGLRAGIPRMAPYFDASVVHVARSVPPEALIQGDVKRGLLRAAVADLIPESLAKRTDKATFEPALARFLRAANPAKLFEPYAGGERLAKLGLVDSELFRREVDAFIQQPERTTSWRWVWCALQLERFLRCQ